MLQASEHLWFLLRFLALYGILLGTLALFERTSFGSFSVNATASATAFVVRILDAEAYAEDSLVVAYFGQMNIIYECTVLFPAAIFVAAVLSFPACWLQRALGVAVGTSILFFLNELRIITLGWIEQSAPSSFETIHLVVWPTVMMAAVVGIWLVWALHTTLNRAFR
jgi:exosortase/archaeosortase family protein